MQLIAYFDSRAGEWRFIVCDPYFGDENTRRATTHRHPSFDLNATAQHDDVWRAMLDVWNARLDDASEFECVLRTRGCYVWNRIERVPEDDFDDEPRIE